MKLIFIFLVLLVSYTKICIGQNNVENHIIQSGKVREYYSGNTELPNVIIDAQLSGANLTTSDVSGSFILSIHKDSIGKKLNLKIQYPGYELINKRDFDNFIVTPRQFLKVLMCKEGYLQYAIDSFYDAGLKKAIEQRDLEMKNLRRKLHQLEIKGDDYQKSRDSILKLFETTSERLKAIAAFVVTANTEDLSKFTKDIYQLYRESKYDSLIQKAENSDLSNSIKKSVAQFHFLEKKADSVSWNLKNESIPQAFLVASSYNQKEEYDSSIVYYKIILSIDSTNANAYENLGDIYYFHKNTNDSAIYYFSKATLLNKSKSNFFGLWRINYKLSDLATENKQPYSAYENSLNAVKYIKLAESTEKVQYSLSKLETLSQVIITALKLGKTDTAKIVYDSLVKIKSTINFSLTDNPHRVFHSLSDIAESFNDEEEGNLYLAASLAAFNTFNCIIEDSLGKEEYLEDLRSSYFELGAAYEEMENYDSSIFCFKKALVLSAPLFNSDYAYYIDENHLLNIRIGRSFVNWGKLDSAISYFQNSTKYFAKEKIDSMDIEDIYDIALSFNWLGTVFSMKNKPDSASYYYKKALLFTERDPYFFTNYFNPIHSLCLSDIADLFYTQNNFDSAIYYYVLSVKYLDSIYSKSRKLRHKQWLISFSNNAGLCFLKQKDYKNAIKYYNKTLYIYLTDTIHKDDYYENLGDCYNTIASVYAELKDGTDSAKWYWEKSAESYKKELKNNICQNSDSPVFDSLIAVYEKLKQYSSIYSIYNECIQYYAQNFLKLNQEEMSQYKLNLYNFSYYCLFTGNYKESKNAALQLLKLDPSEVGVKSNLALAYIYLGDWRDAEKIYRAYRGKKFPDGREWNDVFILDINALKAQGLDNKLLGKAIMLLED